VSVPYKHKEFAFHVPYHVLWDWATDLVQDLQLALYFHWDAEKIFRCSGESSVHVFYEPWLVDTFWDVQVWIYCSPVYGRLLILCATASHRFLQVAALSASYYMLTKPSFPVLAWLWDILLLGIVLTSLLVFGMAVVSVVGTLLGGFPLYVLKSMSSFFSVLSSFTRSQKIPRRMGS
jgi:hypothetical protein